MNASNIGAGFIIFTEIGQRGEEAAAPIKTDLASLKKIFAPPLPKKFEIFDKKEKIYKNEKNSQLHDFCLKYEQSGD